MGQNQNKDKYKAIKAVITLSLIALAVSFYPLIRKAIKNVWIFQKWSLKYFII